jgi:poly-gamma-glutamate capsule biosynthesis protein CapA/YwtB (metallophosphatase superfamily)
MDFGAGGLAETLANLDGAGIESFGAGMNEEDAKRPWSRVIRVGTHELSLRVIGTFYLSRVYDEKYSFYARSDKPGVYGLRQDGLVRQLRALKKAEPESFVVLFPHWGRDYRWNHRGQTRLAHALIDAGADLILGHGAHMMQEIELYRGRWIAYGIGNLMFNSGGRYTKLGAPPYSMPARLVLEDAGGALRKTVRFYPIVSNNMLTGFQPRAVTFREFAEVYKLLRERSWDPEAFAESTWIGRDAAGTYLAVRLM